MPPIPTTGAAARLFSSTARRLKSEGLTTKALPERAPSAWLSDLRARIGKCVIFGCTPAQIGEAAAVVRVLGSEWRSLVAGNDGFISGQQGLDRHRIAWGNQDTFGHINNVTYARYAESARVNWINYIAVHVDPGHRRQWAELMTPRSVGLIMRSLKTDFKFPMTYPDSISVYHKLRFPHAGTASPPRSLTLDCVILSHRHQRAAATLEEDIAIYDYRAGARTTMPPFMQEVLVDVWRAQEQAAARARTRIRELTAAVERLERATWNREDAVEDVGSASSGGGGGGGAAKKDSPSPLTDAAAIAGAEVLLG